MASSFVVGGSKLIGVEELSRKLDKLSDKSRGSILRKIGNATSKIVAEAAAAKIPEWTPPPGDDGVHRVGHRKKKPGSGYYVGPGFAKRHILHRATLSRDKRAVFADVGVFKDAFYAINFVEFQTSKHTAHPWLEPAFRETSEQQIETAARILKREIDKVAREGKQ